MPNATVHVTDHELIWSLYVFISCILSFKWVQKQGLWYFSLHQWNVQNAVIIPLEALFHPFWEFPCILGGRTHQGHGLGKPFLAYLSALTISQENRAIPEEEQGGQWMNNLHFINFNLHYVSIHKYFRDKIHIGAKRKYIFKSCIMLSF